MSPELLDYVIKEAEVGIRIMSAKNHDFHLFNYGTNQLTGKKFLFVMQIVPAEMVEEYCQTNGLNLIDSFTTPQSSAVEPTPTLSNPAPPEADIN